MNLVRQCLAVLLTIIYVLGMGHYKEYGQVAFFYYGTMFFLAINVQSWVRSSCFIFLLIGISLYFPTGIIYGYPADEIILSLLQTDAYEIWGYIKAIKVQLFLVVFFYVLLFYYLKFFPKKQGQKILYFLIGGGLFGATLILPVPSCGSHSFLNVFADAVTNLVALRNENRVYTYEGEDLVATHTKKNLKILVIGESVRRDYMSCYGYPLKTTPFLDSASGVFINGYVAPGPNTHLALKYSLFRTEESGNVDLGKNILNIVKTAGYRITWISNQGRSGWGDDSIYKLAGLADDRIFIKSGDFNLSNEDDFDMLDLLDQKISFKDTNNFVVIHMIGSHEPVCSRLGNYIQFGRDTELNCYLSSIYKLDKFLEQLWFWSKKIDPNVELLYLSDHAVSVEENRIFHDNELKNEYEVPLILLSDSVGSHKITKAEVSGFRFLDIVATWFEVSSPWLKEFNLEKIKDQKEEIDVFYRGFQKFNQITRTQPTLIPDGRKSVVNFEKINPKNCVGNIDNISKLRVVDGWVACGERNKYTSCPTVGLLFLDQKKYEFLVATKVDRQDVNDYLKIGSKEYFGFSVFNPHENREGYVAYLDNKKQLWYCRNLKVSSLLPRK